MILNKINRLIKYKDQRNVRDRCNKINGFATRIFINSWKQNINFMVEKGFVIYFKRDKIYRKY